MSNRNTLPAFNRLFFHDDDAENDQDTKDEPSPSVDLAVDIGALLGNPTTPPHHRHHEQQDRVLQLKTVIGSSGGSSSHLGGKKSSSSVSRRSFSASHSGTRRRGSSSSAAKVVVPRPTAIAAGAAAKTGTSATSTALAESSIPEPRSPTTSTQQQNLVAPPRGSLIGSTALLLKFDSREIDADGGTTTLAEAKEILARARRERDQLASMYTHQKRLATRYQEKWNQAEQQHQDAIIKVCAQNTMLYDSQAQVRRLRNELALVKMELTTAQEHQQQRGGQDPARQQQQGGGSSSLLFRKNLFQSATPSASSTSSSRPSSPPPLSAVELANRCAQLNAEVERTKAAHQALTSTLVELSVSFNSRLRDYQRRRLCAHCEHSDLVGDEVLWKEKYESVFSMLLQTNEILLKMQFAK
eukprot:PhM_4_TR4797/c0_g1_i1/m.67993